MCFACRVHGPYQRNRLVCFSCRRYWKCPWLSRHCEGGLVRQKYDRHTHKHQNVYARERLEFEKEMYLSTPSCSQCHQTATWVSLKFEPPCHTDIKAWAVLERTWSSPPANTTEEQSIFEGYRERQRQLKTVATTNALAASNEHPKRISRSEKRQMLTVDV